MKKNRIQLKRNIPKQKKGKYKKKKSYEKKEEQSDDENTHPMYK